MKWSKWKIIHYDHFEELKQVMRRFGFDDSWDVLLVAVGLFKIVIV